MDTHNTPDRLTLADFRDMAAMEARFYGSDLITPAEESQAWYLAHPFSIVWERGTDGSIAGFVNLFPVPSHIHEGLLGGTFNDALLEASDIVDPWAEESDGPLYMFLSCIVVNERHRGGTLSRQLLARACAQFADVSARVEDVVVDTATPAGERLARRLGFRKVCATDHGTRVWARDWAGFMEVCSLP